MEIVLLDPSLRRLSVTARGDGARVRIEGEPGKIGGRAWTLGDSLVVDVHQESDIALPVQLSFGTARDEATPALRAVLGVLPGVTTRLIFPLSALNAETVFLPRTPGRLKATVQGVPTRVKDVSWVEIGVGRVGADVLLTLSDCHITADPQPLIPAGPVLVDEMGQWTARLAGQSPERGRYGRPASGSGGRVPARRAARSEPMGWLGPSHLRRDGLVSDAA